jgi:chemosensory pili system protein ChpA (sensor histidine kinase/response regulator)
MNPDSVKLVEAMRRVMNRVIFTRTKPPPLLATEVATTLLYLEAAYDPTETPADVVGERIDVLVRRLEQIGVGDAPPAVEPWMEALYRRFSERQRLGSVATELRNSLAAVESALQKYFHNPSDSHIFSAVSGYLSQMHGIFSVLGLPQAANAVSKIRETLDSHLIAEKRNRPIPLQIYEQIARSVSTLGFLIDMLNYQIDIAKEMFVYDALAGEFRYLNGRGVLTNSLVPPISVGVRSPAEVVTQPSKVARLDLGKPLSIALVKPTTPSEHASISKHEAEYDDDDDLEILDIFLDEAIQVVEDAQRVLPPLAAAPAEFEHMLHIRRAFHTL